MSFQESLLEQLQIRDDVGLILWRENDRASRDHVEEQRVVRGDTLERLRGVVVKVRRGVPDPAERRDLERVHLIEQGDRRFELTGQHAVKKLKQSWNGIFAEAKQRKLAAVWLIYNEQ